MDADPHGAAARVIARVLGAHRRNACMLIATDFDGTLAPIVPVASEARADVRALDALDALGRAGVATCIATGRTLDSLDACLQRPLPACVRIAEHGATVVHPGRAPEHAVVTDAHTRALAATTHVLDALAARFPGAFVEHKSTAVALHVRGVEAASRAQADDALADAAAQATRDGMHAIVGRAVLEVRAPLADKATALARVMDARWNGAASVLVYAGDDTTDEPALALASQREGVGVYVASSERPALRTVIASIEIVSQAAWVDALVGLADALGG